MPGRIFVFALLPLLLTGCLHLSAGYLGDNISGADVQLQIDGAFPEQLHTSIPDLVISRSVCPKAMDLSLGRVGHCTLAVDGQLYPVRVTFDDQKMQVNTYGEAAIVSMWAVRAQLKLLTRQLYGLSGTARCDSEKIVIVPVGSRLSCLFVSDTAGSQRIQMKVLNLQGNVFIYRVKDWPESQLAKRLDDLETAHKRGQRTILAGEDAAEKLQQALESEKLDPARAGAFDHLTVGRISCPARLDLTGTRRGTCVLYVSGLPMRFNFWFDSVGDWRVQNRDGVFYVPTLVSRALRGIRGAFFARQMLVDVRVDCGKGGAILVRLPGALRCKVWAGDVRQRLLIQFRSDGEIHFQTTS